MIDLRLRLYSFLMMFFANLGVHYHKKFLKLGERKFPGVLDGDKPVRHAWGTSYPTEKPSKDAPFANPAPDDMDRQS